MSTKAGQPSGYGTPPPVGEGVHRKTPLPGADGVQLKPHNREAEASTLTGQVREAITQGRPPPNCPARCPRGLRGT